VLKTLVIFVIFVIIIVATSTSNTSWRVICDTRELFWKIETYTEPTFAHPWLLQMMKEIGIVKIRFLVLVVMMSVVALVLPINVDTGLWHQVFSKEIFSEMQEYIVLNWLTRSVSAKTTQQQEQSNTKVVACVGDSITEWGCVSAANMTYPSQLQHKLGNGYKVINFGVSGTTMMKNGYCASNAYRCDGNCAYWNTDAYKDAMASNPDIVTIMLGTNDAKGCNWYGPPNDSKRCSNNTFMGYHSAYIEMIQSFQTLPSKPKVYLIIPPPLVNPPSNPDSPPPYNMSKQVLNEFIPFMIPKIANEANATGGIIDTWTALGGTIGFENETMTCDGCHPKDLAMTIIAQIIANEINPYMNKEQNAYS
jgi:lysophospholipase L1-like esterase